MHLFSKFVLPGHVVMGSDMGRQVFDWLLVLASVIGLFLVGAWSIYQSDHSARALEAELEGAARQSLDELGYGWAQVRMDGQLATLTGRAPTPEAAAQAEDAVVRSSAIVMPEFFPQAIYRPGGDIWGGVSDVRVDFEAANAISPYTWAATLGADGSLMIVGHVPDAATRDAVILEAERLFPGRVSAQMELGAGAPRGDFAAVAIMSLTALSSLDRGAATLSDEQLILSGETASAEVGASVAERIGILPEPFRSEARITVLTRRWAAERNGDALELSGAVQTEDQKFEISSLAGKVFEGPVLDNMTVDGIDTGDWLKGVRIALPHFAKFQSGRMAFSPGTGFSLVGEASDSTLQFLAEDIAAAGEDLGITVDAEVIEVGVEELAAFDFEADQKAACDGAFALVLTNNVLLFKLSSAEIDRVSADALDALMTVVRRCGSADLMVEGHTDTSGTREINVSLSRARATAVTDYLVARGFPAEQLQADGFGPDRPVADNGTAAGRALNRRIEIRVLDTTNDGDN